MARTYRRRRADPKLRALFVSTPGEISPWDVLADHARDGDHLIAREAARYHGDHFRGHLGVPTWFARLRHREHKRADLTELRRCLKADCFEDYTPVPRRKGPGYYWD